MAILNTLSAVKEIHKATNLLTRELPPEVRSKLERLRDVNLSFTAFYLRQDFAECRPDQLDSLQQLTTLNHELENP